DGSAIAFVSERTGSRQIWLVDPDGPGYGPGLRPLTGTRTNRFPSWSPDGRRIAFTSDRDGDENIYVMNRDGSAQTRITSSPGSARYPAVSPDGTRIAFRASRGGQAIVTMNLDGSDLRDVP